MSALSGKSRKQTLLSQVYCFFVVFSQSAYSLTWDLAEDGRMYLSHAKKMKITESSEGLNHFRNFLKNECCTYTYAIDFKVYSHVIICIVLADKNALHQTENETPRIFLNKRIPSG